MPSSYSTLRGLSYQDVFGMDSHIRQEFRAHDKRVGGHLDEYHRDWREEFDHFIATPPAPVLPEPSLCRPDLLAGMKRLVVGLEAFQHHEAQRRKLVPISQALLFQRESVCAGMLRYEEAGKLFRHFSVTRSDDQKKFHDEFLPMFAPLLCGSDWNRCKRILLPKIGRKQLQCVGLGCLPRRWGKTYMVAMTIAVLLYMGMEIKILIFANSVRIGSQMGEIVKKFFAQLPDADTRVKRSTDRFFAVTPFDDKDASRWTGHMRPKESLNTLEICSSIEKCKCFFSLFFFYICPC